MSSFVPDQLVPSEAGLFLLREGQLRPVALHAACCPPGSRTVYAVGATGMILRAALPPRDLAADADWSPDWDLLRTGPAEEHILGIAGPSQDNLFAVGTQGLVLHYDGAKWTRISTGLPYNVFGSPIDKLDLRATYHDPQGGDLVVVGQAGTVLSFDGTHWAVEKADAPLDLHGVSGGASGLWCCGSQGIIWTRSLTRAWRPCCPPATVANLYTVAVAPEGEEVLCAGEGGTVLRRAPGEGFCHEPAWIVADVLALHYEAAMPILCGSEGVAMFWQTPLKRGPAYGTWEDADACPPGQERPTDEDLIAILDDGRFLLGHAGGLFRLRRGR